MTNNFNFCLKIYEFPNILKYADVTPAHNKDAKSDVKNYRPNTYSSQVIKDS